MAASIGSGSRHLPIVLFLLAALPALLVAFPTEALEAISDAGDASQGVYTAHRSELFLAASEGARLTPPEREGPAAERDADEESKAAKTATREEAATTTRNRAPTTTRKPIEDTDGTLKGAIVFLLPLVPFIYVIVIAFTDTGIVVVAKEQDAVQLQETQFDSNKMVMVASIEHDICFDLDAERPEKAKVSAGGLGKVAGQLQRIHPTDLICVHPVFKSTKYGWEHGSPEAKKKWHQDDPITVEVDGMKQTVRVFRMTVKPQAGEELRSPQVTYLMLEHPWFRNRTGIYLDQPGSIATLCFFSLWNQAVGALIAREEPWVYQCPDYHTALAPWYGLRANGQARPPPRVAVVLHNAEYQGAISSQQLKGHQVRRLAKILDLPPALVKNHMMIEGGFNMLQAGMEYVSITQQGYGVCAVSKTYAEESKVKHRVLWPLPEVIGLDNPMLENERPAPGQPLPERRRKAKEALYAHQDFKPPDAAAEQTGYGFLRNNPNARIFVFLGRWVKQKGMDYIADIAEWMVATHPDLQLAIIGPPGDSFGSYCDKKLRRLATNPTYAGRLKLLPVFYDINQVHADVKFAFDFCFMPSRDEPFGYVDIEFGWFGALTVGSITGGLGKVPGIYYLPSNVNSAAHICHLFKGCVDRAMALSDVQLTAIAQRAIGYKFPVEVWQEELMSLYIKADNWGNRVGSNTAYLRRYPEVFQLFRPEAVVPPNHQAPRRMVTRRPGASLETAPMAFSYLQMQNQDIRVGRAAITASFSLRADGADEEVPMDQEDFIRREVGDEAIKDAVEDLVTREAAQSQGGCCCSCKEPLSAQDVLAVTQWHAMNEEEFGDRMRFDMRQPCWGFCKPVVKFLTKWLAGDFFGLKRIDLFIALHYFTAPLLQALCVAQLPSPEKNKWPMVMGAIVLPFAVYFWTKLSMVLEPNRVMALAVVLRIPLLFLSTITTHLHESLETVGSRVLLFCLLSFLAGADQIFVFYNFMGAAVGDIAKLALRMGMCNGILGATSYFGQIAITYAVSTLPSLPESFGGATPLSYFGLLADVLFAVFYICAPAPYREFCLPEWDLQAMWKHRRTLKYLFANIVLGAVTDPSISGNAIVIWRTALEPFSDHNFLGADSSGIYQWLMPLLLAVAVIVWSYILYRCPNRAASMTKAGAFLLAPPALLRCVVALTVKNNDSFVTAIDLLFIVSLVLDVIWSTCIYIALLSVVGSRWRFVSFVTVALFVRYLLAAFVKLVLTVLLGTEGFDSYTFAKRWMPALAFVALLQWVFSIGGFFFFDRESSALLTDAKKRIASENNRGLAARLRELEG